MNIINRLKKHQKGAALPLALILMGVGATLTIPMLSGVTNSLLVSRHSELGTSDGYAANAGLEDAIWDLIYGDLEATEIPDEDDSFNYQLSDPVNGSPVDITVTNKGSHVASDDFESNTWSGGTGWLGSWTATGMTSVINGEQPYEGNYHARIRASSGGIKRAVDLSNLPDLELEFMARVKIFEQGDEAKLKISNDGINWTELYTWTYLDSDDTYYEHEIDLSPYTMSSQVYIWFDAIVTNGGDKFFVDDLEIEHDPLFEVVVTTDDSTTTALVIIDSGVASIYSLSHE